MKELKITADLKFPLLDSLLLQQVNCLQMDAFFLIKIKSGDI